jgi:hypothetical protein
MDHSASLMMVWGEKSELKNAIFAVEAGKSDASPSGPELAHLFVEQAFCSIKETDIMKYGLAWLLGIPIPILAVVYLVSPC